MFLLTKRLFFPKYPSFSKNFSHRIWISYFSDNQLPTFAKIFQVYLKMLSPVPNFLNCFSIIYFSQIIYLLLQKWSNFHSEFSKLSFSFKRWCFFLFSSIGIYFFPKILVTAFYMSYIVKNMFTQKVVVFWFFSIFAKKKQLPLQTFLGFPKILPLFR